jgi:PAS domain S-box-containing protein
MTLSFRQARNAGLATLLIIIFLESLFSYITMSQNYNRLSHIITVDEVKLRRWYDVAEIIAEAKDHLTDYKLGKIEVIASVDLLVNRAMKEMDAIKKLAVSEEELTNIDQILTVAKRLKQAVYAYEAEVRDGYRTGTSAFELENIVNSTADRIGHLSRDAALFVGKRIADDNIAILELTAFSRRMLAFVLFIAIIATIVVSLIMARALARPIEQLLRGTQRIADGDLSYRVSVETDDHIGQLASSFNRMAGRLKKSRQELLASKEYTDNIIKSMINSLVVVNEDATIRNANQATYTMLNYENGELIGKPFSTLFAEGYYSEIGIDDLINRGFTSNVETVYQSKNGRKIRVLFSGSIIFDADGEFDGLLCVAQDITIQTEALRAGHLASIGELAAGVAHEINNPINGIINFAQIIIDEIEKGQVPQKDIPAMIIKEGDRVAAIVRSLLSFARESENVMSPVDVWEILDDVLTLTQAQLNKDGIQLTCDLPKDLPKILANFQQIQQVFLNIINNSRYALNKKFKGSAPQKNLYILGQEKMIDNQLMLQMIFHDRGMGIPAHIIDKVLNPFFSTKPAGSGTGLGLAISHGIISNHGGKINIESLEGEYTKVTILFRIAGASPKNGIAA